MLERGIPLTHGISTPVEIPYYIRDSMALIAVITARPFLAAPPAGVCALEPHVVLGLSARTWMDNHFVSVEMGLWEMDMNVRSHQKRVSVECRLRMKVVVSVSPLLSDGLIPSMRLRCLRTQVVRCRMHLRLAIITVSVLPIGVVTRREDAFHRLEDRFVSRKAIRADSAKPWGAANGIQI